MITVVRRVDDDGVVSQALGFEFLQKATDGVVDTGDHPIVRPHVGLIAFVGIPPPEVAFAVDGGLEEWRQGIKGGRVIQPRRRDVDVLVQAVGGFRPGKGANARTAIAVFGVAGIEPHVQRERAVFGLRFDKVDSAVDDQICLMAQRAVWLRLVKRVAADGFKFVKVIFPAVAFGHPGVPLAEIAGAIAGGFQMVRVQRLCGIGTALIGAVTGAVAAAVKSGEDGCATDPADGVADERIGKAGAGAGQLVDVGRLNQ